MTKITVCRLLNIFNNSSDLWRVQSMLWWRRHLSLDQRFTTATVCSSNSLSTTKFFLTAHH